MAAAIRLSRQHSCSFNHLVGERKKCRRNFEVENLCRLYVDDEFELTREQDRHLGWFLALEDAPGIDTGLAKLFRCVRPVTHQSANLGKFARWIYCRHRVTRGLSDDLDATVDEQPLGGDQKCVSPLFYQAGKCNIDVMTIVGIEKVNLTTDRRSSRL